MSGRLATTSLFAGLAILVVVWGGLLPFGDPRSFSLHMIVHMAVVAAAAPLIALGLSGSRFDPTVGRGWVTAILASVFEAVIVWSWHSPALRELAETTSSMRALEQACFLLAGVVLWLACLGGATEGREERRLGGTVGLLFTSMHMTLLGALLALSPRPLYGNETVTCLGVTLSPETDQQGGAVIMLLIGAAVYLAGGVSLLSRSLVMQNHKASGANGEATEC